MSAAAIRPRIGDATVRKIKNRVLPFLVVLYIIAFIDRANVGYVAMEMNADLGITTAQFGLAAGLFSIGYFLFEVPSNMLMRKVGARDGSPASSSPGASWPSLPVSCRTSRSWPSPAHCSASPRPASSPASSCTCRYWFPERERARVVALFMIALPVATVIAAPLSGLILDNISWLGMEGWRWVFILEGAPAAHPRPQSPSSSWSTAPAQGQVADSRREDLAAETTLQAENRPQRSQRHGHVSFWRSLAGGRALALSLIYYSKSVAIYVLAFFTPQIVAAADHQLSNTAVGYITAIPYGIAAIFMV